MNSPKASAPIAPLRFLLLLLLLTAAPLPATAVPGLGPSLKKAGQDLTEYIAKKLQREQAEELSSQATRKLAARVGRSTGEVETLLTRYGDDAAELLCTPQRAKLSFELGDDAARAFIKHGQAAEDVLRQIPSPDLARAMQRLSREETRSLSYLISKGFITPSNSRCWSAAIEQRGGSLLPFVASHLTLSAIVAACCLSPETTIAALSNLYDIASFAAEHPLISLAILILLSALYIRLVQWLTHSPITLLKWLGLIIGGGLWRLLQQLIRRILPRKTPPVS